MDDLFDTLSQFSSAEVEYYFLEYLDKYDAIKLLSKIIGGSITDSQKIEILLKDYI